MAGTGSQSTLARETLRSCPLLRHRLLTDLVANGLLRFDGVPLMIPDGARLAAAVRR